MGFLAGGREGCSTGEGEQGLIFSYETEQSELSCSGGRCRALDSEPCAISYRPMAQKGCTQALCKVKVITSFQRMVGGSSAGLDKDTFVIL